jgi:hypothetical protein
VLHFSAGLGLEFHKSGQLFLCKDKRAVDLISDGVPFGRLWYGEPNAVASGIGYAEHRSRSHDAVIRVYDSADNVIETHVRRNSAGKTSTFFAAALKIFATNEAECFRENSCRCGLVRHGGFFDH